MWVSRHTTTPASQCRLRRPWRESSEFPTEQRSEQAAILPRIQLGHEQWRSDSDPRSSVTFLVTHPAIGSWRLWPGRCIECRSAQDLDLNLSAVHEDIRRRAYGQRF